MVTLIPVHFMRKVSALAVVPLLVAVLICCGEARAQRSDDVVVKRVVVINEIGRGVKAEIRIMDPTDKDTHFAYTNDSGVAEPNQKCPKRHRLLPKPQITGYRVLGKPPYCATEVTILVHLPRISFVLIKAGDKALVDQKHGLATMLYTEAAWRLNDFDPVIAKKVELKAYGALGKQLGIRDITSFDPQQDRYVLSYKAVKALQAFQRDNQLAPSGLLDATTTRTMAGEAVFPYIRDAYREPGVFTED